MKMILTDSERYNVGLLESVINLDIFFEVGSGEPRYPVSSYKMVRRVDIS